MSTNLCQSGQKLRQTRLRGPICANPERLIVPICIKIRQKRIYRWRKLYGGMQRSQLTRLKELEKENQRLRRAVSDLTLDKLILSEAAKGNF